MHRDISKLSDKLIWALTVFLMTSFFLFETYAWGKYAFFVVSIAIFFISVITNGGKIYLRIDKFQFFAFIFVVFSLISSLWALRAGDSILMARTLLRTVLCFTLIYWHYIRKENVAALLSAIKWAGFFVAVYSIIFYGWDTLLASSADDALRLENEYSNINSIGMVAALSCFLQFAEWLYGKFRLWTVVLLIPSVVIIAATQSRKALIFAIAGLAMLIVMKNLNNKNVVKGFGKVLLAMGVFFLAVYFILRMEIFAGMNERFETFLNSLTGAGKVDASTLLRENLRELGFTWWKKYPLGGIGIANPHILAARYLNFDAYLHDNFVELLCGGGIIGFALYYSMYAYLFCALIKYRNSDKRFFSVCMIWMILILMMDYGRVSYSSKTQWFYLMVQFINIECLKKSREKTDEYQKNN